MENKMKIVCISDTHNNHEEVLLPEGDILVHTGDFTHNGSIEEYCRFINWLEKQKQFKHKIIVPGNHDFCCERVWGLCKRFAAERGVLAGLDEQFVVEGINFFCSPWQPWFYDWAFNATDEDLKSHFSKITADTNVLLTHGPSSGILDDGKGSKILAKRIKQLKELKYVVFGHIHEGYGVKTVDKVTYINAALTGSAEYGWEKLDPKRKAYVIEYV